MVWQTIKNIFGCRTNIKQLRKKLAKKMPTMVDTPGPKAKSTPKRNNQQSSAGKKKVVPMSTALVGSLVHKEDVDVLPNTKDNTISISKTHGLPPSFTDPILHSTASNTDQQNTNGVLHTNNRNEHKSRKRDILWSCLKPLGDLQTIATIM